MGLESGFGGLAPLGAGLSAGRSLLKMEGRDEVCAPLCGIGVRATPVWILPLRISCRWSELDCAGCGVGRVL